MVSVSAEPVQPVLIGPLNRYPGFFCQCLDFPVRILKHQPAGFSFFLQHLPHYLSSI
jgi:hypothetical protein